MEANWVTFPYEHLALKDAGKTKYTIQITATSYQGWHTSIPYLYCGSIFVERGHWGAGSDAEYAAICLSIISRRCKDLQAEDSGAEVVVMAGHLCLEVTLQSWEAVRTSIQLRRRRFSPACLTQHHQELPSLIRSAPAKVQLQTLTRGAW